MTDKYLCTFPTNVISEGIWDLLNTSGLRGLYSANVLCVSGVH